MYAYLSIAVICLTLIHGIEVANVRSKRSLFTNTETPNIFLQDSPSGAPCCLDMQGNAGKAYKLFGNFHSYYFDVVAKFSSSGAATVIDGVRVRTSNFEITVLPTQMAVFNYQTYSVDFYSWGDTVNTPIDSQSTLISGSSGYFTIIIDQVYILELFKYQSGSATIMSVKFTNSPQDPLTGLFGGLSKDFDVTALSNPSYGSLTFGTLSGNYRQLYYLTRSLENSYYYNPVLHSESNILTSNMASYETYF